jgi:cytochrome c5
MRERIAVGITILAVCVLLALSVLFAVRQNPGTSVGPFAGAAADAPAGQATGTDEPHTEPAAALQESDSLAGLRVFRASGCERCHSVAGAGSPRYPLDGVGSRRNRDELRVWTVGAEAVQDSISPSALRAKQRYQQLSAEDMRVLLSFMAGLIER